MMPVILLHTARGDCSPRVVAPGIVAACRSYRALTEEQKQDLASSLRRITGWQELWFDGKGVLQTGDLSNPSGGSATARATLLQALLSGNRYEIENHSGSQKVHFGQLDQGTNYEDMERDVRFHIWRVRIDFHDFTEMHANPMLRESFDTGLVFLHEILHGFGHRDTRVVGELGECERLVNHMRAELGLALRQQYHGEMVRTSLWTAAVRLRFRSPRPDSPSGKPRWKTHYLCFVISLNNPASLAAAYDSTVAIAAQ